MPVFGLPNLCDLRINRLFELIKNKKFPNPSTDPLCIRMINYLK